MRYPGINPIGANVVITGAARGIGLATARAFAARGAHVALGDLDGELAAREAAGLGPHATGHRVDVTDKASYAAFLAEAAAAHGELDILVNNAGVMPNGHFLELDDAVDRLTVEVNLHGVRNGMRLALPGMTERGRGHVVNIASLAGKFPVKGLAVYNATKFAVVGLTAATRLEMRPHGVSVSAVLPSAVDTSLASGLSMAPLPKVEPEAIAAAVLDSVRTRAAELAVPRYVGVLANLARLTPEPALNLIRRLVRDDRALRPDRPERRDYTARLTRAAAPEKREPAVRERELGSPEG
ncbi:SDR family oxidoreductase [Streptomyces sp. NA04227]|uniref:SDR family oxidoreductase n=1 Tax=Streptomyces sp. NA04227 TaxID=2742136 RepID=UPI001591DE25|nr:SDR family oxidoreductase [Streptomyces sp. NA04227]QKW08414.1 SDR family oxidoreductase [Streptomyces sp. NA04227]